MRVFLSWSGERSKYVAETVRGWLPKVLQSIRPWMSQEDISAGSRWIADVSSELSEAKVGIICVTPENQHNPWLQFESGALSKTIAQTYVCPLLLGMEPGQITGPLTQFQSVTLNYDGVLRLLKTLNAALAEQRMPEAELEEIFSVWWPKLNEKLVSVPDPTEPVTRRSSEEMMEEILQNTREQIRRENLRLEYSKERDGKFDTLVEMLESSFSHLRKAGEVSSFFGNMIETIPASIDLSKIKTSDSKAKEHLEKLVSQMKDMATGGSMMGIDVSSMAKTVDDMKTLNLKQKELTESILRGAADDEEAQSPTQE